MATTQKLAIIDADAHVVESERTWDYLEPAEEKYRPVLVSAPNDPTLEYWLVEHKIRGFRFKSFDEQEAAALSAKAGKHLEGQRARREMADVQLRLRHLDAYLHSPGPTVWRQAMRGCIYRELPPSALSRCTHRGREGDR